MIGMQMYQQQVDHPFQYKYEFDITPHGLEFLSASTKTKRTDNEQWLDAAIDADGCAYKGIKSVLDRPATAAQDQRPSGISEEFWDAANHGNPDAQLIIGKNYEAGIGVPQDYVEAYFWLDIAASGKTEIMKPEDVAKLRDSIVSHLTPTVLLQTQERARKWFNQHQTSASQP
jgi:TPR repeat protein